MPILDFALPDDDVAKPLAWMAMPIATPLQHHLGKSPGIEGAVSVVACIARTLSRLHEAGIFHRDIKPDNLFVLEGRAVIGDFGLVAYPGKAPITQGERHLGTLRFIAPEMTEYPGRVSNPGPGDVYSLAKTLYVLIAGQNYPPLGPQRAGDPTVSLGQWVVGSGLRFLENLIDRATSNTPSDRPTMREFADELDAWDPNRHLTSAVLDFSPLAPKVVDLVAMQRDESLRGRKRQEAVRTLACEAVLPLREVQVKLDEAEIDAVTFSEGHLVSTFHRGALGEHTCHSCELTVQLPGATLMSGLVVDADVADHAEVTAAHVLSIDGRSTIIWEVSIRGRVDSCTLDSQVHSLIDQLVGEYTHAVGLLCDNARGVARFADRLPRVRHYRLSSILTENVGPPGSILVAFAGRGTSDEVLTNITLFPGEYDASLLDRHREGHPDAARLIEQAARMKLHVVLGAR